MTYSTITLWRQDFKVLSDGYSSFDSILQQFGIPESRWPFIAELTISANMNYIQAWNSSGTLLQESRR